MASARDSRDGLPNSFFTSPSYKETTTGRSNTMNTTLSLTQTDTYNALERTETVRTVAGGLMKLRPPSDDLPQQWWFASTAIPLVAATIGPLSNVLSIVALVMTWRVQLPDDGQLPDGTDDAGVGLRDPNWEIGLNAFSLVCGFAGNLFLLLNFTARVRYIVALPVSIVFWVLASSLLIGTTVALHMHAPPIGPGEMYSQGYWHAVLASILYFLGGLILTINLVGYLRGHYPQNFDLDDDQRTLILQTMMFFFWLAMGAAVFAKLEGWTYADAVYYADVTVLTIGFGDLYPQTDAGRGFLFVFEPLGIIFLGLVISSISRFAANISADKIIKTHQRHARESTVGRTVTNEAELRERLGLPARRPSSAALSTRSRRESLDHYGRLQVVGRTVTFKEKKAPARGGGRGGAARTAKKKPASRDEKMRARASAKTSQEKRKHRRQKLLLLQEEKDRFEAMREIQDETKRFKQYTALGMALLAFGLLWFVGAVVFMLTEARLSQLTYFEALYFCFVSLLTIGYGDFSPKSNIGRPFFVVWSLIAVPTMTVLISEMSKTVGASINRGTFRLADFTLLPKKGVFKDFLDQHTTLRDWLADLAQQRQERRRIERGFEVQDPDEEMARRPTRRSRPRSPPPGDEGEQQEQQEQEQQQQQQQTPTLEQLAAEDDDKDTEHDLARELALAIKSVAQDLRADPPRRYEYEQWVHFTKLIRFSNKSREEVEEIDEAEGLVDWDWIGEDSPMLADITEAEWVLDRLCESLNRYTRTQASKHRHSRIGHRSVSGLTHPPDTIDEQEDSSGKEASSEEMTPAVSPETQGSADPDSEGDDDAIRRTEDMDGDHLAPDQLVEPRRTSNDGSDK